MKDIYEPPFHMTDEITNLVIEIGELVGEIRRIDYLKSNPTLRRENRIRSIYSSLAIEQNTLSLDQVSDIIDGKRVLGPPQDIREVKNAYEAYEYLSDLDPYDIDNLLLAHKIMMKDLTKDAGRFRSKNVGVYSGGQLIHAGTPANYVPELIRQLFDWAKNSSLHPLVKSCIFHYEFEFIHPFSDGNGRTGRLWQTLMLKGWKEFFGWLPVETLIHEQQEGYYEALNESNTEGESTVFVAFMLKIIRDALRDITLNQNSRVGANVGVNVGTNEEKVIVLLKKDGKMTASKIADTLGISTRQVERIMAKLKKQGALVRHGAPKSGYWEIKG